MNAMLDPRAFIPFLYDPATLSLLQQQQQAAAAAAALSAAAQSKGFSLPTNSSSTSSISNASSSSASSSFRIHDLLDASKLDTQNPSSSTPNSAAAAAAAALAQMMGAAFPSSGHPLGPGGIRLNSSMIISDQANSSGENDSLLDELDGNHSSRSSSAGTPPLHERSSGSGTNANNNNGNGMPDRSSNCSSSASIGGSERCGGPMHSGGGKKARKARTIFTDKQLQELETTFDRQKYLSVQDRMDLAHRMGLSDTQVKTWYQNRRTKWKRQAAVGVDLLHEANNLAAVQNLIRTNPYWSQYLATHGFAQQRLCQAGIIPPNGGGAPSSFPMIFPPGMFPSGNPGSFGPNGFPSNNNNNLPHDLTISKSPENEKCGIVKDESVSPKRESPASESPEVNDEKLIKNVKDEN